MNKIIVIVIVLVILAGLILYWQYFYKPQEKGFTPSMPEIGNITPQAVDVGSINPGESIPSTNPLDDLANPFEGGYENPFE